MKKNEVTRVVATGIGAAIIFILMKFVIIPTPIPNTTIQTAYGFIALFAALFGPVAAAIAGFIGHVLSDATTYGIWLSWEIATAVLAFLLGWVLRGNRIEVGIFDRKDATRFLVGQLLANAIAWGLVAPVLDILIYSEPVTKVFIQGAFAAVSNSVAVGLIGFLLIKAYANTRVKSGSLYED